VLQAADCINKAALPTECLKILVEAGEAPAPIGGATGLDAPPEGPLPPANDRPAPQELLVPLVDHGVFPIEAEVADLLRGERWEDAAAIWRQAAVGATAEASNRLYAMASAVEGLGDEAPIPAASIAELLPSSAAWISNDVNAARLLTESRKTELAYRTLSGIIAADSNQQMPRHAGAQGSWAGLLDRTSPFRRQLPTDLPARTARTLGYLVTGSLGTIVAERLWDAATNLAEAHTYRTPLLTFLHEQGAHEAIVKLAGRNEPGIVSRLAQLFELRAVALNRPDLVPVAQAMADQIMGLARGVPFRSFLRSLPIAAQSVKPTLELKLYDSLRLRKRNRGGGLDLQVVVRPVGLVPAKLEAILFPEDDVTFEDGNRRRELSQRPVYFATDFTIRVRFGDSWFEN
jgi:hypothetical protein